MARQYVPQARAAGASVVDFSAAFRQSDAVPLLIPAINGEQLQELAEAALVAALQLYRNPAGLGLACITAARTGTVDGAPTYRSVSGFMGQATWKNWPSRPPRCFPSVMLNQHCFPSALPSICCRKWVSWTKME